MNQSIVKFFTIAIFLLYIGTTTGCKQESHNEHGGHLESLPSVAVETATVEESVPIRQVEIMGTVQAAVSLSVSFCLSLTISLCMCVCCQFI